MGNCKSVKVRILKTDLSSQPPAIDISKIELSGFTHVVEKPSEDLTIVVAGFTSPPTPEQIDLANVLGFRVVDMVTGKILRKSLLDGLIHDPNDLSGFVKREMRLGREKPCCDRNMITSDHEESCEEDPGA